MNIDHLIGESFTNNMWDYVPITAFIIIPIIIIIGMNYFIKGTLGNKDKK